MDTLAMIGAAREFTALTLLCTACSSAPDAAPAPLLGLRSESHAVRIVVGDETFARIALGATDRVCITDLRAPGGQDILRGFPFHPRAGESVDHPEQTGIWMAHAAVDGNDLWTGPGGAIATEHTMRIGPAGEVVVAARIEWRDRGGGVLCTEARSYTFWNSPTERVVDIVHRIAANGGGLVLGDVREGFFAMRFADSFQPEPGSPGARSFSSKGARNAELWGQTARWVASIAAFERDDAPPDFVTVCILDHPDNIQHPPVWNARPYGLVAANPFARTAFADRKATAIDKESGAYMLDGYEVLVMRYRVVISASALDYNAVDTLWAEFARAEVGP